MRVADHGPGLRPLAYVELGGLVQRAEGDLRDYPLRLRWLAPLLAAGTYTFVELPPGAPVTVSVELEAGRTREWTTEEGFTAGDRARIEL